MAYLDEAPAGRSTTAYEAGRHLVVFSDLPQDVNDGLAREFYKQKHLRVQIYSKTDSDMRQSLGNLNGPKPDILIASEDDLRTQSKMAFSSRMSRPIPTMSRRP